MKSLALCPIQGKASPVCSLNSFFKAQDCRNNPLQCDKNAKCRNTKIKITDDWTRFACECNKKYNGNGFSCIKKSSDYNDLVDLKDLM